MKYLKRNRKGIESDKILLEVIKDYPGLSQYELAKKLRSTSGLVDGSVRRLLKQHRILLQILERNGRRVNLIYLKKEEERRLDVIEVPTKLLEIGNPLWDKGAFFYALDSSTIGVSGKEMPQWKEVSCFVEEVPLRKSNEKVIFSIPQNFLRFYNMERKHRVVSISGNNVLITISGDIINEKKYPS